MSLRGTGRSTRQIAECVGMARVGNLVAYVTPNPQIHFEYSHAHKPDSIMHGNSATFGSGRIKFLPSKAITKYSLHGCLVIFDHACSEYVGS